VLSDRCNGEYCGHDSCIARHGSCRHGHNAGSGHGQEEGGDGLSDQIPEIGKREENRGFSCQTHADPHQMQKDAWATIFSILQSDVAPDVHLFAATTLKGKVRNMRHTHLVPYTVADWGFFMQITYDLATQVPETDLPALRDQLLLLLRKFAPGPKPVRVQLCVCLAILALQMRTWTHVLSTVVSSLGDDTAGHAGILDFLRVLPEEVTEGRKINLSVRGASISGPGPRCSEALASLSQGSRPIKRLHPTILSNSELVCRKRSLLRERASCSMTTPTKSSSC
jgi:hypothetical protein